MPKSKGHGKSLSAPTPPPPPAPLQILLDARDTAVALGRLSLRSLRRGVAAGRIPRPRKIGGRAAWDAAELWQWSADGCPVVSPEKVADGSEKRN